MTKHNKQPVDTDQSLVHDCTDQKQGGDLIIKLINVQDRFIPIGNKSVDFKLLETIVTGTKIKGSNSSMKVTAYGTWYLTTGEIQSNQGLKSNSNHQYLCPGKKKPLKIDRSTDSSLNYQ